MSDFLYLASPYSKFPRGLNAAFEEVCRARGLLIQNGVACFSPIIHSHPVAQLCRMDPYDHSIWMPSEEPILRCAKGLIMLRMESWEISYGMNEEKKIFEAAGKPIVWMDPGVLPGEFARGLST